MLTARCALIERIAPSFSGRLSHASRRILPFYAAELKEKCRLA